jgi:hypothetical protein
MGGFPGIIRPSGRVAQGVSAASTRPKYRMTNNAGADAPVILCYEGGISRLCTTIQEIKVKRA